MKKYLLVIFLLCVVSVSNKAFANPANAPFSASVKITPSAPLWRWRSDNSTLKDGSWTTTINQINIPEAELNRVYRIRIGANFNVTATAVVPQYYTYSYNGPALIYSFKLLNNISFLAQYRYQDNTTGIWSALKAIPNSATSAISTDAIAMNSASVIGNKEIIPYEETTDMLVLPKFGQSSGGQSRPTNPNFYLGGIFYKSTSSDNNVGNIGYEIGDVKSVQGSTFVNNSSYTSYVSVNPTTFINMGAEVEASMQFLNGVKANTLYEVQVIMTIPFTGTGAVPDYKDYPRDLPETTAVVTLKGQFKTPATVLPVSLKSFLATKQGNSAQLNWVTASEVNNKGFYVQKSTDGKTFSNLGFVGTQASGGNSNTTLNYNYTDATPGSGAVYYRLNQVDLDGKSKYSDIQSLFMGTSSSDVMIAPNPVISNVNLNNAQIGADYTIYNMSGQLVKSGKVSASVMSIDASNLPSGIYVIKTSTNAGVPVFKKFVKK